MRTADQALGMDPAQSVLSDIELAGVIADDDSIGQKVMRLDAAPQRALGGDRHWIGVDLQGRDAELVEVQVPGGLIREEAVGRSLSVSEWIVESIVERLRKEKNGKGS